jgi:hypothetical protein
MAFVSLFLASRLKPVGIPEMVRVWFSKHGNHHAEDLNPLAQFCLVTVRQVQ